MASGSGAYLEHNEGCLTPALREEPTDAGTWTVTPTGESYANTLVSACGAALHANENSHNLDEHQNSNVRACSPKSRIGRPSWCVN
jgi:hypothetical protein